MDLAPIVVPSSILGAAALVHALGYWGLCVIAVTTKNPQRRKTAERLLEIRRKWRRKA